MDIIYILKDLVKCKFDLERFLFNRLINLDNPFFVTVPKGSIKGIVTTDNVKFNFPAPYDVINEVNREYNFSDIRASDIVLDIGANVGCFSLKVKDKCKKIFSVEPVFYEELEKNIKINMAEEKITVFPFYLGEKTLTEIIQLCGGHVDFLKIDCEGAEWCIKELELKGIRRIEAEIHSFNGELLEDFLNLLSGYKIIKEYRTDAITTTMLIHAFKE